MSDGGPSSPVPSVHDRWLSGNQQYPAFRLRGFARRFWTIFCAPAGRSRKRGAGAFATGGRCGFACGFDAGTPALFSLCAAFELSAFERDLLLLCVGSSWSPRFVVLSRRLAARRSRRSSFMLFRLAQPQ